MINYANINISNVFTEGFEASVPSDMTLRIGEGTFVKFDVESPIVRLFPAFEFELEADNELDVLYDIYLLNGNNESGVPVHVDRTELGFESLAIYEGTTPLLHCLASILVPPNTTNLNDISITMRNIFKPEGAVPNENTTE